MLNPSHFNFRVAITAVLAIAALVAFNLTHRGVQSELEVSFNRWYDQAAPALEQPAGNEKARITIRVHLLNAPAGVDNVDWSLPVHTVDPSENRSRVARVLQLIHESNVFRLTPVAEQAPGESYVAISVVEGNATFETIVPYDEVRKNVRLQNLLKLLEVFTATQPRQVNPTQL